MFNNSDFSEPLLREIKSTQQDKNIVKFFNVLEKINLEELNETKRKFSKLSKEVLGRLVLLPSVSFWLKVMDKADNDSFFKTIEGNFIKQDPTYITEFFSLIKSMDFEKTNIHRADKWLRVAFNDVVFESEDIVKNGYGKNLLEQALSIIHAYKPSLSNEINLLCSEIQFVKNPSSNANNVVSFSDDIIPGVIYICLFRGKDWISPYDLADSIIHEYRHQKLYLLEEAVSLIAVNEPLVFSPWPKELRPPKSLFHALFVFNELIKFWRWVSKEANSDEVINRGIQEINTITQRLQEGFCIMRECSLTDEGRNFLYLFMRELNDV